MNFTLLKPLNQNKMASNKTYMIQSKLQPYELVYGAWLNGDYWCWLHRNGATVYMPKELYKVISKSE